MLKNADLKTVLTLFILMLIVLLSGCAAQQASPAPTSSAPPQSEATEMPEFTPAETEKIQNTIYELSVNQFLLASWQGSPVLPENPISAVDYKTIEFTRGNGEFTVTLELYGNLFIDPATMKETLDYGEIHIRPAKGQSWLPFGRSTVRMAETGEPLSCAFERYPQPGLDYLKAETERLAPELAASEKLDVSQYDPALVNYIWRLVLGGRYVASPEELTLYDLANLTEPLELHYGSLNMDSNDPDYRLDASLLRLMPKIPQVWCVVPLEDYSVFETMHELTLLHLHDMNDTAMRSLKIGHTDELMLNDPAIEVLDMTGINTDTLRLASWSTAVKGFHGCDKLKNLYISSTRTDIRLVNVETFPSLEYINLIFHSETARVRDLSQLATFTDVPIDICLSYQACNNKTVESLIGVKLNTLVLDPKNGQWPLSEPDAALVEKLDAKEILWDDSMYFEERTKP